MLVGDGVPRDLISIVKFDGLVSTTAESVLVDKPSVVSVFDVWRSSAREDDWCSVNRALKVIECETHNLFDEILIGEEFKVGPGVGCGRAFPVIR